MLFQLCMRFLLASISWILADTANQPVAPVALDATTQPVAAPAAAANTSIVQDGSSAVGESAETPQAEAWTLRYKFQSDQRLRYETQQTMTLEAMLGESRRVDNSKLKQRRVFTVLSVEDSGAAQVAMQFEHVWMEKQIDALAPVEFDSTMKPADVPVAFRQVAHELKGIAPKYWMSNRGLSLYPPVEQKPIQLVATTEQKENDPGSFLMMLPEDCVRVGDTWKETISVPVRVTQEINRQVPILRTFRLDAVENGIATISFRSSIETSVKGATVRSQLIQATPRGTMTLDIERGIMLRRVMRYNETVVGALGSESVLSSVGTNTEALIEDEPVSQ